LGVREAKSAGVSFVSIRNICIDANFEWFAVTCNKKRKFTKVAISCHRNQLTVHGNVGLSGSDRVEEESTDFANASCFTIRLHDTGGLLVRSAWNEDPVFLTSGIYITLSSRSGGTHGENWCSSWYTGTNSEADSAIALN
jgi:hypothetical protein